MTSIDEPLLSITSDRRVSDRAIRLWLVLLTQDTHHCERRFITADYAQHLHCSTPAIRRALESLAASGWAHVRKISARVWMVRIAIRTERLA